MQNIIIQRALLHSEHLRLLGFYLPSSADAYDLIRNQRWKNWCCSIFLFPWLVSYLWETYDHWIFVNIGSVIFVSWTLRILMLLKSRIDVIMDSLTMLFQLLRPLGHSTPGAENKYSSLWAMNGNKLLNTSHYLLQQF